jgi:uncharacterized spore protein YtfJ
MAADFNQTMGTLFSGMDTFLSTKTVVGEPTKVGDTILLPLVDVTFGVGAGAYAENGDKKNKAGGGMGGKMTPSAILVIQNGHTRLVNVKNQETLTKLMDMIPDILDRFGKNKKTDAEVIEEIADEIADEDEDVDID